MKTGTEARLAAVAEAVGHGQQEHQILGVEDQARPDDVAVRRVVRRCSACLDLHDDAVVIVKDVYVVGDLGAPVASVQDWAPAPTDPICDIPNESLASDSTCCSNR